MSRPDVNLAAVGWVSDSVTQQIQEQSPSYGGDSEMLGYATLTQPTVLPNGWITAKLGHIIDLKYGKSLPDKSRDGEGLPVFGSNGIVGKHSAPLISGEGLIIGRKGSFGEVQYSATPFFPIDTTYFVDRFFQQPIRYWCYQLKYLPLTKLNRSTAIPGLNHEDAYSLNISLPPLAEQQQITAKLDELLAQVDTLKTRLNTIPKILKRFRQSVLAAAVSGKLTKDWRNDEKYTKTEFGWYIPSKWQLLVIDEVAEVKGGKRLPKGEVLVSENTGFPYIHAGQLKSGTVIEDDQLFLLKHVQAKISRYIENTEDLYITIAGACIGDAGIIPLNYDGATLTENAAKLCLFKKPLKKQFLSNSLRSQYLQDIIQHEIKSGAQGKLALKRIKTLPFPYPSIEEQTEIVRRVEQLFTYADQIEQRVKDAQARVNHLTQSILAKAFRGELTTDWREQNPELISGKNSAKVLLAKIKAERETTAPARKTSRKAKT